jgi:hypothetical protein
MTIVGRSQIDHPALGTAGGSALHAAIETIYTNIGNDLAGRYETAASVANSTLTTFTHNFGVQFADLKVLLYTGTFPNLVRVSDPVASGWTIAANGTNPKTQIDVTTPGSGGPHTFALMITHGRGAERLKDLDDVDFTVAPVDGQLFIYDSGTSKWEPAYLRYTAETAAIASNTITPTTGTTMQRITSGTGDIQMIAGPTAGKVYVLVNETGSDKTLKNDTGATAANRIYTGSGADLTLKNQAAVTLIYNSGLSRWVVAGGSGGGGLAPSSQNANFTAAPGNNYLTDTSGGPITATLPAGTTGATIQFVDATESWGTNNLTITPASGEEIDLLATDESLICDVVRGWVQLSWNGSFWAFSSLASTTVGEASASSSGIVTTGTQTFAGDKTFNGSLTPSGGIVGKTDGVAVAAGKVGEIYTTSFTGGALTTGVAGRSAIINLPSAGVWLIFCTSVFTGTATTMTQRRSSIGTSDSLNFTLSATNSYEAGYESFNPSAVVDPGKALSPIFINSSSAPTVYVWSAAVFSGGSLNHYGYITAIRVAA